MFKKSTKTYLAVPLFMGLLALGQQVAADEVAASVEPVQPTSVETAVVATPEVASVTPEVVTTPEVAVAPETVVEPSVEADNQMAVAEVATPKEEVAVSTETPVLPVTRAAEETAPVLSWADETKEASLEVVAPVSVEATSQEEVAVPNIARSSARSASPSLPESGTYRFTERTPVKHEPAMAAETKAYYEAGETVNYDRKLAADNHEWLSYVNYAGGRSYVPVNQLVSQVPPATQPTSTPGSRAEVASTPGVHTFTARTAVKSEPKVSARALDFYEVGETVRYDERLEADGQEWLKYTNYRGGKSYVAVKALAPVATPASQPAAPSTPAPTAPVSSPSTTVAQSGVHTFTARTAVKAEPKVSARALDFYEVGETVRYDERLEADGHEWLKYTNYRGGKSYVAVKALAPVATPVSQPAAPAAQPAAPSTPAPVSSPSTSVAQSGVHTFTARTAVKSEPKVSARALDFYEVGETVRYDERLEADGHEWLKYTNYRGGKSYVAVKALAPVATPVSQPAAQPSAPAPVSAPNTSTTQSGVHTFTARTAVKSEPKVSARALDFYEVGETVRYDERLEADGHEWLKYTNYRGGKSYVAVKALAPVATPVSQPAAPAAQPAAPAPTAPVSSSSTTVAQSGVHTFTARTAVKSEPKVSARALDFYEVGEKVRYDERLEADGHEWLKYTNYRGGKSYVAIKALAPVATPAPQPAAPSTPAPVAPASSPSTPVAQSGVHTFTARTAVKSEPKVSARALDFYEVGEKVRYDERLEADGHEWLKYTNYRGGKSYVAVKALAPVATPVSQPAAPAAQPAPPSTPAPVSSPSTSVAQSGVHTFTARTAVKSEPKVSARALDFYEVGETVRYDERLEADGHEWLKYTNYRGGKSYVAVKPLASVATPVSQPAAPAAQPAAPAPTTPVSSPRPSVTQSGVHTFTARTAVKSEPKVSARALDFYEVGEKVRYDERLEADGYEWLKYTNYRGGKNYVAIKPLVSEKTPVSQPVAPTSSTVSLKNNAMIEVSNYQEKQTYFTVDVKGQEDTAKIKQVRVAVWSDDKGPDDLSWYQPSVSGNQASAAISIANHSNTSDNYHVNVYTTYDNGQTIMTDLGTQKITKPSLVEVYGTTLVEQASEGAKKVLALAGELIGVKTGDPAHKQLVDDYNAVRPLPVGYKVTYEDDWCDVFTTVMFQRAGLSHLIGRECGVERHVGIFKNLGIWQEDGTITPKTGDIITFNWNQDYQSNNGWADHIGIVSHVENGLIHTIEGNGNKEVVRRSYKIGHGNIRGFAKPRYI